MATTKKPVVEKEKKAAPKPSKVSFEVDFDALTATNDWPLYTPSTYVRAKQLDSNEIVTGGIKGKAGQYVVVTEEHEVSVVDADKFERAYECVKGPHKREF